MATLQLPPPPSRQPQQQQQKSTWSESLSSETLARENVELKKRLRAVLVELERGGFDQDWQFGALFYESIIGRQMKRVSQLSHVLRLTDLSTPMGLRRPKDVILLKRLINELAEGLELVSKTEFHLTKTRRSLSEKTKESNALALQLEQLSNENAAYKEENSNLQRAVTAFATHSKAELSIRNAQKSRTGKLEKQLDVMQKAIRYLSQTFVFQERERAMGVIPASPTGTFKPPIPGSPQAGGGYGHDQGTVRGSPGSPPNLATASGLRIRASEGLQGRPVPCFTPSENHARTSFCHDLDRRHQSMRRILAELMKANAILSREKAFAMQQKTSLEQRARKARQELRKLREAVKKGAVQAGGGGAGVQVNLFRTNSKEDDDGTKKDVFHNTGTPLDPVQVDFLKFLLCNGSDNVRVFLDGLSPKEESACIKAVSQQWEACLARDQRFRHVLWANQRINSVTSVDEAMQQIIADVCNVLQCDRASFWIVDNAKREMWTRKATGAEMSQEIRIPLGAGLVGEAWRERRSINVKDAYKDDRFDQSVDRRTKYRTKTVLCIPIHKISPLTGSPEKVVCVLQAINKYTGAFTEEDEFLMANFGSNAATVIEKCTKNESFQWFISRKDMLIDVAESLQSSVKNVTDLMFVTRNALKQMFSATAAALFILGKRSVMRCTIAFQKALRREDLDAVEVPHEQGIVGECAASAQPVILEETATHLRYNMNVDIDTRQYLFTFPVPDEKRVRVGAVLQFAEKEKDFAEYGSTYDHQNAFHKQIVMQLVKLMASCLERTVYQSKDWATFLELSDEGDAGAHPQAAAAGPAAAQESRPATATDVEKTDEWTDAEAEGGEGRDGRGQDLDPQGETGGGETHTNQEDTLTEGENVIHAGSVVLQSDERMQSTDAL